MGARAWRKEICGVIYGRSLDTRKSWTMFFVSRAVNRFIPLLNPRH